MTTLSDLDGLRHRLARYVEQVGHLRPEAIRLLEEALFRGEVERGDVPRISGLPPRSARRTMMEVLGWGLLASDTARGPLHLKFPASSFDVLFPRLFPLT